MTPRQTQVGVHAQTQSVLVDQLQDGRQRYPRDGAAMDDALYRGVLLRKTTLEG